ncbi:MAG: hypothetical protein CVU65_10320 [Deltaproteobacteria bacterium HGW-Deltaproteobacteria-22]|jgi:hypothetical protein|nr:MAG: hypothetical protein CVU65_10320 [Deltaproteobacteria bacterium HGW-Deltaproteobacteria-22]
MQLLFLVLGIFLVPPAVTPPAAPPPPAFTIASDAALVKLQKSLPAGWSMKIPGDRLVIRSQADVWVLFENRINAPDSQETDAQRIARIIRHGKKMPSSIELRLEKKWSRARLDAARAKNGEIHKKIAALVDKHGLTAVFLGNSKLSPGALAEQRGLGDAYRRYENEKKLMEAGLIQLPEYESTLCSLWLVSTQGASDGYSLVHPDAISMQSFAIRNSLKKVLTEVK